MERLIEVEDGDALPPGLTLGVGDVLRCAATGGRVHPGGHSDERSAQVVQMAGPFLQGVVGSDGQVHSPVGSPNTVLFLARHPGKAKIDIVTGDPWRAPKTITLDITVES